MRNLLSATALVSCLGVVLALQACSKDTRQSGFDDLKDGGSDGSEEASGPIFDDKKDATPGDENNDPLAGCASNEAKVTLAPAYFELVIDRSGSMSGTKWQSAQGAIAGLADQFFTDADTNVGMGLILFPGDGGDSGPYPDKDGKDPFPNFVDATQRNALKARVAGDVTGGTPTLEAMTGAYNVIENLVPLPPLPKDGKKIVVLMTDGVPNSNPGNIIQTMAGQELAKAAPKGPIQTYVVGIGNLSGSSGFDVDPRFLGSLAVAGGTGPKGCDPNEMTNPAKMCHYHIQPGTKTTAQLTQEIGNAFKLIRAQATACEISLASDDAKADPSHVNVVIVDADGKVTLIKQDGTDGWTYDDPSNPTKVILHGAACESAIKNIAGKTKVVLGCKTVAK
jgi:hypothetical protein